MAHKAGLLKKYENNFELDEGKLRKLASVFEQFVSKLPQPYFVKYYVELSNNSFYSTRDIDEVLSDPNTVSKAIQAIVISIEKEVKDQTDESEEDAVASLGFNATEAVRVQWGISHSDRDWCFLLADEIDSEVSRTILKRPFWFRAKNRIDLIVVLTIFAVLSAWLTIKLSNTPPLFTPAEISSMPLEEQVEEILINLLARNRSTSIWIVPVNFVLLAIFFAISEIRPIGRLLENLDRSVFYWGDGIKRWDSFKNRISLIKWGVVVAFLVSLTASFVGRLF